MRQITVKYTGDCVKCHASIEVGAIAIYEKRVGIFCPSCAPTDTEEIRAYRQEGANRKADRLEEWAAKREARASATLNSHSEIRHDIAFNTQPGHIPFRARMIAADDRAFESLNVATGFRNRAESLRHVRVKGNAQRADIAKRDALRPMLAPGVRVHDWSFGLGTVAKVNTKTAGVKFDRLDRVITQDLIYLRLAPAEPATSEI